MRPHDPLKLVLACLIALLLTVAAPASLLGTAVAGSVNQENNAEIVSGGGGNSQSGDDISDTDQSGGSASGDAIAGQVFGSVSAGDVSGDAINRSSDVDVESGEAIGSNDSGSFVGQLSVDNGGGAANFQTGDNDLELAQRAVAVSGDAVGGQVIGVVTAAGGSADIVAANISDGVDVSTGQALSSNDSTVFVGLLSVGEAGGEIVVSQANDSEIDVAASGNDVSQSNVASIISLGAANSQDGDNEADLSQAATAASGDGVAGQVIGVVSAGDSSVDATNSSSDVDVDTGDSESANDSGAFVGLLSDGEAGDVTLTQVNDLDLIGDSDDNTITQSNVAAIAMIGAGNDQVGDNVFDHSQAADSASGDGVGGQVIGAVTSSGGSADIVAANTSDDIDASTGSAESSNGSGFFVGLLAEGTGGELTVNQLNDVELTDSSDNTIDQSHLLVLEAFGASNRQEGDNEFDGSQSANAASGDGVGGQVIGVVSSGDASIDATNSSSDVDVGSGDVESDNDAAAFVGLLAEGSGGVIVISPINGVTETGITGENFDFATSLIASVATGGANIQGGDNSHDIAQSSTAASGDGVGGQVIGVGTSAGGTADIVVANESADIDLESGESAQSNDEESFVGLRIESDTAAPV